MHFNSYSHRSPRSSTRELLDQIVFLHALAKQEDHERLSNFLSAGNARHLTPCFGSWLSAAPEVTEAQAVPLPRLRQRPWTSTRPPPMAADPARS